MAFCIIEYTALRMLINNNISIIKNLKIKIVFKLTV